MTTLEILEGAREALLEHGWLRGDLGAPGRGFCAAGALMFAAHDSFTGQAWQEVYRYVLPYLPPGVRSLVTFNNSFAHSVDDVITVFDRAISDLEARECALQPE